MSPCNCHERVFATMPMARQLTIKLARDPKNFDLEKWIEIRGRGPKEVEMDDIKKEQAVIQLPCIGQKAMRL